MKDKIRGFEIVSDKQRKNKDVNITLPTRGSKDSAGYDFYTPIDIVIKSHSNTLVWTDVKAYMLSGDVLMMYVRSSIGVKKGLTLANGTGIIDADYYNNPSNDGNIGICLHNNTDEEVTIAKGERIAQGVFLRYFIADNDKSDGTRLGGFGSTNK